VGWALLVAELVLATRDHWIRLDPQTRERLWTLVSKSKGRPSNLSRAERNELMALMRKLRLFQLGRNLAGVASPVGGGRRKP
jgi:hypothetical protein